MDNPKLEKMRLDYSASQSIASFYPIKIKDGSTLEEFCTQCSDCNANIPDEHFRGMVSIFNNGNTIVNRGVGFCKDCMTLWRVDQRTKYYKGSILMEFIKDGQWVVAYARKKKSKLGSISLFLKSIFMPFGRKKNK
jgi:hypothetical protein